MKKRIAEGFDGPRRKLRQFFSPQTMPLILLLLVALAILVATISNVPWSDVSEFSGVLIPLVTIVFLLVWHYELLAEQTNMRRLQTRPQVLVYFARKPIPGSDRDRLILVIEHFGGGPALDVRFGFDPPLVNESGTRFEDDPPFSTGIAVMPPGFKTEIEFADFYEFHNQAGLTRIVNSVGHAIDETRLSFQATVTLRDPFGDDTEYTMIYQLDLAHLMPYTMK